MSQRKPTELASWLRREKSEEGSLHGDSKNSPSSGVLLQGGHVPNQPKTPANLHVRSSTLNPNPQILESPLVAQDIGHGWLTQGCQPSVNFEFPRNENGRSFKHSWFSSFKWLHYFKEKNCALCYQCMEAVKKGMKIPKCSEQAFIQNGFKNWKKGTEKFKVH